MCPPGHHHTLYIMWPSVWVTMEPLADWYLSGGHIICLMFLTCYFITLYCRLYCRLYFHIFYLCKKNKLHKINRYDDFSSRFPFLFLLFYVIILRWKGLFRIILTVYFTIFCWYYYSLNVKVNATFFWPYFRRINKTYVWKSTWVSFPQILQW